VGEEEDNHVVLIEIDHALMGFFCFVANKETRRDKKRERGEERAKKRRES